MIETARPREPVPHQLNAGAVCTIRSRYPFTITLYEKFAISNADSTWHTRSKPVPARLRPWLPSPQIKIVQHKPPRKKPPRNTGAVVTLVAPAFAINAPPTAANHKIAEGDDTASNTPRKKPRHWERCGALPSA